MKYICHSRYQCWNRNQWILKFVQFLIVVKQQIKMLKRWLTEMISDDFVNKLFHQFGKKLKFWRKISYKLVKQMILFSKCFIINKLNAVIITKKVCHYLLLQKFVFNEILLFYNEKKIKRHFNLYSKNETYEAAWSLIIIRKIGPKPLISTDISTASFFLVDIEFNEFCVKFANALVTANRNINKSLWKT